MFKHVYRGPKFSSSSISNNNSNNNNFNTSSSNFNFNSKTACSLIIQFCQLKMVCDPSLQCSNNSIQPRGIKVR